MNFLQKKLLWLSTQRSLWVYGLLLAITLLSAIQFGAIEIDTDPENMLPSDHSARVYHNQVKSDFSMHDVIVVGVIASDSAQGVYTPEVLKAIHEVSRYAIDLPSVIAHDLMSFSTVDNIFQEEKGELVFSWLMQSPPSNTDDASDIWSAVQRLPMLYNTLAAESGKAAAIYIPIEDKNESYRIAESIREFITERSLVGEWHITGLPIAEDQFGVEMFIQMGLAAPAAGVMIFLLLYSFFRNWTLVIAPMVVAMATVIVTMGALIGCGFTVHIMSSMIAIFLMPIAVVDSVHILSEFTDRYKSGQNASDTITDVVKHLFTPMLYTSLTSAAGFFSLMLTPIPPVQIFGAFIGSGILLAFLFTLLFVPAYISRMSDSSLVALQHAVHTKPKGTIRLMYSSIGKIKHVALNYRSVVLVFFALLTLISIWGVTHISINDNPVRWFKSDHEIRRADYALNKEFAGTYNGYLVLESTQRGPEISAVLSQLILSDELAMWKNSLIHSLSGAPEEDRLDLALTAIDDAIFEASSHSDLYALEHAYNSLAAIQSAQLVFQQPEVLSQLGALQRYLDGTSLVGKSQSVSDVVKVVNRELHSGDDQDYVIPATQAGVAQTLMQFQSSHRPHDLWHFVTPDYKKALVWLQLTSGDNQDMTRVIALVDDYFKMHPLPENIRYSWAGKAYLNVVWQQNMVAGMMESLLSAFVIVFIMMVLLFRSVIYGVLAMLPLTITIVFIYGMIGIVGKDYDMPIAVLSALTLGLSVDFAIHFLARAKALHKETDSVKATLNALFDEPASAISRNALVIAFGFTPLLFAPLMPYVTVGIFLASIMAISALVTLLVLPSLLTLLKSRVF